jgi:hypothetical protein
MPQHPPVLAVRVAIIASLGFGAPTFAQGSSGNIRDLYPTAYVGSLVLPEPLVRGSGWPGDEISGIALRPDKDDPNRMHQLLLVPDDRSKEAPARIARVLYRTWVPGYHFEGLEWITLLDEDGKPFARNTVDPESVRAPADSDVFYWASEGYAKDGIQPALYESRFDGGPSVKFSLPDAYLHDTADEPTRGIRQNEGFESLALDYFDPRSPSLVTCPERPLIQDRGSGVCRILHLNPESGESKQFGYPLGPAPAGTDPETLAVAELLSVQVPDGYLVLENAEREDGITVASLWLIRIGEAEDLSNAASLRDRRMRRFVEKKLVLDFSTIPNGAGIGNLEGMELIDDVLYLVEDNEVDVTTATRLVMVRIAENVLDGTIWDHTGENADGTAD